MFLGQGGRTMSKIRTVPLWANVLYDLIKDGQKTCVLYLDMYLDVYLACDVITLKPYLSVMTDMKNDGDLLRLIRAALEVRGLVVETPRKGFIIFEVDLNPWEDVASIEAILVEAVHTIDLDLTKRGSPTITKDRIPFDQFFVMVAHLLMQARSAGCDADEKTVWRARGYEVLRYLPSNASPARVNTMTSLARWCRSRPDDCEEVITGSISVKRIVGSWEAEP